MTDASTLMQWITPIITTVVAYIKTQGIQKAADKAAEALGEKAAGATVSTGKNAFTSLHDYFSKKADKKAKQALANVEQDPDDDDYQEKLGKETARLASADPMFAQQLQALAKNVPMAQPSNVAINNEASNYGPQGVFNNSPINNYAMRSDKHNE